MKKSHSVNDQTTSNNDRRLILAALFIVSFAILAFEVGVVRVLSVVLNYHNVFLIVSAALLGLGLGGIIVHAFSSRIFGKSSIFQNESIYASLLAIMITVSIALLIKLSYQVVFLDNTILFGFIIFVPFLVGGMWFAVILRKYPTLIYKVYGADLLGAAAGSFGAIFLLNSLGGINTCLIAAVLASVIGLVLSLCLSKARQWSSKVIFCHNRFHLICLIGVLFVFISSVFASWFPNVSIGINPDKEIHQALQQSAYQGEIVETRWNSFGRTDLVASDQFPEIMGMFIDGTAGMPMFQFNGDLDNPEPSVAALKEGFTGYFPFFFLDEEERDNALIIGPGGGRDVLVALMGRVKEITAVEVDQDVINIVNDYAWYNGGLYQMDNVNIIADEGRNYIKRKTDEYDVIMMSIPVIKSSRTPEAYALTENYLFTSDSIGEYFDRLTDDGRLMIVPHTWLETLRLLSISLDELNQRGIDNQSAMQHIYIIGTQTNPLFVLKKTPFDRSEVLSRFEGLDNTIYSPDFVYFPGLTYNSERVNSGIQDFDITYPATIGPALVAIAGGELSFDKLIEACHLAGFDISPVSDNNPFFFKLEDGLPKSVSNTMSFSIIILLVVVLGPVMYLRKNSQKRGRVKDKGKKNFSKTINFVLLFIAIGIGFMITEISLIQKLILFLGQPVLSIATIITAILAGAGIGSISGQIIKPLNILEKNKLFCLIIIIMLVAYAIVIPIIFNNLLGVSLALRIIASIGVIIPLGFLLGLIFPSTITLLNNEYMPEYIPWMWGINGASSVLGSVIAIVVGITFGFYQALFIAAGCYFIAFLVFDIWSKKAVERQR